MVLSTKLWGLWLIAFGVHGLNSLSVCNGLFSAQFNGFPNAKKIGKIDLFFRAALHYNTLLHYKRTKEAQIALETEQDIYGEHFYQQIIQCKTDSTAMCKMQIIKIDCNRQRFVQTKFLHGCVLRSPRSCGSAVMKSSHPCDEANKLSAFDVGFQSFVHYFCTEEQTR